MPFSHMKERLELVDEEKLEIKSSIIEGGDLGKEVESATTHFKFESSANGGCIVKVVATYKLLPGVQHSADKDAKVKEAVTKHIKAVEAYLLANLTAYAWERAYGICINLHSVEDEFE